jgi:hypothetical protein
VKAATPPRATTGAALFPKAPGPAKSAAPAKRPAPGGLGSSLFAPPETRPATRAGSGASSPSAGSASRRSAPAAWGGGSTPTDDDAAPAGAVSLPKRPPSTGPDPDAPPPGAVSMAHPPAPDTEEHPDAEE